MVFKKRYSRSTRYGMRKRFRKFGTGRYAPKVSSRSILKNVVETVVSRNSELKYIDTAINFTFPVGGGAYNSQSLTDVTQGVSTSGRVGDRVRMRSITIHGAIVEQSFVANANSNTWTRVIIVQYFPSTASGPSISNILQTSDIYSSYNMEQRQLFRVLYDKQFVTTPGIMQTRLFRCHLKFAGKLAQVQYQAGGTTATNKVIMYAINSAQGATNNVAMACTAMLRYYDY